MTAEERMAYFQGEKYRTNGYQRNIHEKNPDGIFLKIRFFIAVVFFIIFLSLDYTGYQIHGIGSQEIMKEITTDIDYSAFFEKIAL